MFLLGQAGPRERYGSKGGSSPGVWIGGLVPGVSRPRGGPVPEGALVLSPRTRKVGGTYPIGMLSCYVCNKLQNLK